MDLGVGGRGGARRRTRRRHAAMNAAAQPKAAPQAPQQLAGNDTESLLAMLKVLHKEGLLSDQELADKKAMLIERM